MAEKQLRIGFDFDGVIAYNPVRIFRRPAMWLLEILKIRKKGELYYPVPGRHPNRLLWALLHETSYFPAHGLTDLKKLLKEKKIKAYLITGRYSFVKRSLLRWLKFHGIHELFEKIYVNDKDEQPHEYKERILKKLKLDMYVEDNWDIVEYLNHTLNKEKTLTEIHWVYNVLDRGIQYHYKYPYLKKFIDYLKNKKL
jgi:hypothetical protein